MLNAKTKPKQIPQITGVSLWTPSSPDHKPLDMLYGAVLKSKTNAASHPNIGSLKKMSKEFILKECKSFRRRVNTIIEKKVAILSKFTVLCLSSYFVFCFFLFFSLKLTFFYNRVVYYYTRIFLILIPYIWTHLKV